MAHTALSFNAKKKRFTLYISRKLCIFTQFFFNYSDETDLLSRLP